MSHHYLAQSLIDLGNELKARNMTNAELSKELKEISWAAREMADLIHDTPRTKIEVIAEAMRSLSEELEGLRP